MIGTVVSFRAAVSLAIFLSLTAPCLASAGAFRDTKHGSRTSGVQRATDVPRGSCVNCHSGHSSTEASARAETLNLFAPNDDNLCFNCHLDASAHGTWGGSSRWSDSEHARPDGVRRPGRPMRKGGATEGQCLNCHDPHGARDRSGVIPSMLVAREEALCLECHDGARANNVAVSFRKNYSHPVALSGRHAGDERPAGDGAGRATDRHSECADCHNVHALSRDVITPSAPEASGLLAGVSRVQVINGVAGSKPAYEWKSPGEPAFARQYELCFKCHSSAARQPAGQEDVAALTNPSNASFHPIQARGTNATIDRAAFVNDYDASSILYCTDCHAGDEPSSHAPHGSNHKYILRKQTIDDARTQPMREDNLCFACHSFDVYANAASPPTVLRASRFNFPSAAGHAFHVGAQSVPCFACHETHGSIRNASLISTTRMPGIRAYSQTAAGGNCVSSCHQSRSYTVNYPR